MTSLAKMANNVRSAGLSVEEMRLKLQARGRPADACACAFPARLCIVRAAQGHSFESDRRRPFRKQARVAQAFAVERLQARAHRCSHIWRMTKWLRVICRTQSSSAAK